jgi:hypothetical protein
MRTAEDGHPLVPDGDLRRIYVAGLDLGVAPASCRRPSPVVLIERCGTPFGGDTVPEQETRLAPRARVYIKEENNLERRATAQADRRPNIEQR